MSNTFLCQGRVVIAQIPSTSVGRVSSLSIEVDAYQGLIIRKENFSSGVESLPPILSPQEIDIQMFSELCVEILCRPGQFCIPFTSGFDNWQNFVGLIQRGLNPGNHFPTMKEFVFSLKMKRNEILCSYSNGHHHSFSTLLNQAEIGMCPTPGCRNRIPMDLLLDRIPEPFRQKLIPDFQVVVHSAYILILQKC